MVMTSGDCVRVRHAADARHVSAVLARAFQHDHLMRYAVPDARERACVLPRLIGLTVRYGCRYGEVYATPGYEGAAVWLPPGRTTLTLWRMLVAGALMMPLSVRWSILRRLGASESVARALHTRCAPGPHWYLVQIGVEPAHQRQGIGSRLLRSQLARLDAAGFPCYLETENEANLAFYQRHGFHVAAEESIASDGPHIWGMLRSARADSER